MHGVSRHTKVFTRHGLRIAEEIRWFDEVMTNDGCFHSIDCIKFNARVGEDICKIRLGKQYFHVGTDMLMTIGHFDGETVHESVCKASDIKTGDMVKLTISSFARDISDLSVDDCRMCGLICRYGGFVPAGSGIEQLILDQSSSDQIDFVYEYLSKRNIDTEVTHHSNSTKINWNKSGSNTSLMPTLLRDIRMRRLPAAMLNLPKEKTEAIVEAILGDDESVTLDCPNIIDDLQYMLYRLHRPAHVLYRGSQGMLNLWYPDHFKVVGDSMYLYVTEINNNAIGDIMYEIFDENGKMNLNTLGGNVRL